MQIANSTPCVHHRRPLGQRSVSRGVRVSHIATRRNHTTKKPQYIFAADACQSIEVCPTIEPQCISD